MLNEILKSEPGQLKVDWAFLDIRALMLIAVNKIKKGKAIFLLKVQD